MGVLIPALSEKVAPTGAVDAEVGGSGEGQVHVQVKGPGYNTRTGKFLIKDPSDLSNLPGTIRANQQIQNAIAKAFQYLSSIQQ